MNGYVYVLTNPSMPNIVKIGRSIHGGKKRARDLFSGVTGIPTPFELDFEMMFDDCATAEMLVHEQLSEHRISADREFFSIDSWGAQLAIMRVAAEFIDHTLCHSDFCMDEAAIFSAAEKIRVGNEEVNALAADIADAIADEIDGATLRSAVKRVRIKRARQLLRINSRHYDRYVEAFPEAREIAAVK